MPSRACALWFAFACCLAASPLASHAQPQDALGSEADAMLRSASIKSLDGLFQAVHAVSTSPADAEKVCAALASPDRGSAQAWLGLAQALSADHRDRLTRALGEIALSAWQGQPAPFDESAARTSLRQAGVRAALLHDGFSASALGSQGDKADVDIQAQRCRSLGWLLDAVASRPQAERAAITRLMLRDGLASVLQTSAQTPPLTPRRDY